MEVEILTLSREGTVTLPRKILESLHLPNSGEVVAIASIPGGDGILLKPVRHPAVKSTQKGAAEEPETYSEEEASTLVSRAVREVRQEKTF